MKASLCKCVARRLDAGADSGFCARGVQNFACTLARVQNSDFSLIIHESCHCTPPQVDLVEHEDCHHGGITALIIAFSNILRIGSLLVTVALESLWLRECKIIKAFLLSLQENLGQKAQVRD